MPANVDLITGCATHADTNPPAHTHARLKLGSRELVLCFMLNKLSRRKRRCSHQDGTRHSFYNQEVTHNTRRYVEMVGADVRRCWGRLVGPLHTVITLIVPLLHDKLQPRPELGKPISEVRGPAHSRARRSHPSHGPIQYNPPNHPSHKPSALEPETSSCCQWSRHHCCSLTDSRYGYGLGQTHYRCDASAKAVVHKLMARV